MGALGWFRQRRQDRLFQLELARVQRRLVDEDVTLFGEQLSDLHVETMTTELDEDMRVDYQKALDLYEQAKQRFHREATEATEATGAELVAVGSLLEEGRFRRACVLARRDGSELPARLPPCFFNPQHGPSVSELGWAPPGGVERAVPVCRRDLNRMRDNLMPDLRVVRIGGHYVPWYAAGSAYEALEGSVDSHAVTEGKRSAQASYALYVGPDHNGVTGGGMFDNF
ncbi:hypothetical protein [Nocardioides psychrotolerans]|uniref:Uncharacterized protein n=1 Tax=Nocardioides psychrotolerans TaxID=1005945 RepID=A0A1I3CGN2_9ACTN|nr:hypothetical protein [Nocardioides psychrotolerans]SFH73369.1 hypothetical protein SAMN05216561_10243 [Nocardioides psychrotolerans]